MTTPTIQEIWKPMPFVGFDHYSISNIGRVRRDTPGRGGAGCLIKTSWGRRINWYPQVKLYNKMKTRGVLIHRAVALAFLGQPIPPAMEVNHKDGDKTNSRVENLEWVTRLQNTIHAHAMGLIAKPHAVKLTAMMVMQIRKECSERKQFQRVIAHKYNISPSMVCKICCRVSWAHLP